MRRHRKRKPRVYKPLSIFRIDGGGSTERGPRTAIVVASTASNARQFATAAAKANGHADHEFFRRSFSTGLNHHDQTGSICLRIGLTTPLGGCQRAGEVLRLDPVGPRRLR